MYPLEHHILPLLTKLFGPKDEYETFDLSRPDGSRLGLDFRRNLHALVAYALPQERFSRTLYQVLMTESRIVLGLIAEEDTEDLDGPMHYGRDQEDLEMTDEV